jgi:DNA-directed RNA polymerase subunit M/transcription elongation factor TFIIS
MYYTQNSDKPCAYITKGRQRIKQFGQNVYLKNGSEFEIELYNPSRQTVLSKIKINGEFINGGGIILKPGERVFLERYIDDPRKFKFETYTVDTTNETMNAIANNGDVEILFYEEQVIFTLGLNNSSITYRSYNNDNYNTPIGNNFYTTNGVDFATSNSNIHLTSNSFSFSNNATPRSSKYEKREKPERRLKSKSIETGRVEKGSSSDQSFTTVSKNFNSWTVSTSVWKILPESQKPIEKRDLIEKCPKCSTKVKKSSWKFCPECGSELKRTKTEIHYTIHTHVNINGREYLMTTYQTTLDDFLKKHENKLIYIKSDSLTSDSLRAIVID